MLFPDCSSKELYQFVLNLYNFNKSSDVLENNRENSNAGHRDFGENYIQETSASEEPRLVFARKSKPAELVTEAEAHGAGHREASSISKAISDKRVNGEDETLDKIPRLSSVVVGVEDNTGDKEYPCLTCGN